MPQIPDDSTLNYLPDPHLPAPNGFTPENIAAYHKAETEIRTAAEAEGVVLAGATGTTLATVAVQILP